MRDVLNTPKDFGHNKWVYLNSEGLAYSSTYLRALQDGVRSGTYKLFRNNASRNISHFYNNGFSCTYMTPRMVTNHETMPINKNPFKFTGWDISNNIGLSYQTTLTNAPTKITRLAPNSIKHIFPAASLNLETKNLRLPKFYRNSMAIFFNHEPSKFGGAESVGSRFSTLDDRFARFTYNNAPAMRLKKLTFDKNPMTLLDVEFNTKSNQFARKVNREQAYLVIKQKRYVAKKFRYKTLPNNFIAGLGLYENDMDIRTQRFMHSHQRKYDSTLPSPMHKRLLRTRRMLVLPAHINLAVITNSFDVVHS